VNQNERRSTVRPSTDHGDILLDGRLYLIRRNPSKRLKAIKVHKGNTWVVSRRIPWQQFPDSHRHFRHWQSIPG